MVRAARARRPSHGQLRLRDGKRRRIGYGGGAAQSDDNAGDATRRRRERHGVARRRRWRRRGDREGEARRDVDGRDAVQRDGDGAGAVWYDSTPETRRRQGEGRGVVRRRSRGAEATGEARCGTTRDGDGGWARQRAWRGVWQTSAYRTYCTGESVELSPPWGTNIYPRLAAGGVKLKVQGSLSSFFVDGGGELGFMSVAWRV